MICIWQTPPKIIRWRRWKRTEEWWRMGSHTVTDHRREEIDDQNVGLTVEDFTNEESCLLIIRRVTLTDKPGNGLAIWAGTSREKNIDEMNVPPKLEATKVVEQGTATDRGWLSSGKCEICSWCVWDCLPRASQVSDRTLRRVLANYPALEQQNPESVGQLVVDIHIVKSIYLGQDPYGNKSVVPEKLTGKDY